MSQTAPPGVPKRPLHLHSCLFFGEKWQAAMNGTVESNLFDSGVFRLWAFYLITRI